MGTVAQLKYIRGAFYYSSAEKNPFFFVFPLSLLFTPHPPEKIVLRPPEKIVLRPPENRRRGPTPAKSSEAKSTMNVTQSDAGKDNPVFHKPISPFSPISVVSHPWQCSLKPKAELGWAQKPEATVQKRIPLPKVSVLNFFFHYFLWCLVRNSFLVNGFLLICWNYFIWFDRV